MDVEGLILQVLPVADSDAEELADLAGQLRAEVLSVDAISVVPLTAEVTLRVLRGPGRWPAGWRFNSGASKGFGRWWPPCADGPRGRAAPWRSASAGTR